MKVSSITPKQFVEGKKYKCCLCGRKFSGYGNNPYPLCDIDDYDSRCCDDCNESKVLPARLAMAYCDKKYIDGGKAK